MKKRVFYLHLGLPKTGTTFLQREYYCKISNIRYLGKFDGISDRIEFIDELFSFLFIVSDFDFQRNAVNSINLKLNGLERKIFGSVSNEIPLLISEEEFTCQLLLPQKFGIWGILEFDLEKGIKRLRIIEKELNLDFKFIFTKRDSLELAHSFYAQFYWRLKDIPTTNTFQNFLSWGFELNNNFNQILIKNDLEKYLVNYFSRENVLTLYYQDFNANPQNWIEQLTEFLKIKNETITCDYTKKHNSRGRAGDSEMVKMADEIPPFRRKGLLKLTKSFIGQVMNELKILITKKKNHKNIPIELNENLLHRYKSKKI
jgi:hypothetical protein